MIVQLEVFLWDCRPCTDKKVYDNKNYTNLDLKFGRLYCAGVKEGADLPSDGTKNVGPSAIKQHTENVWDLIISNVQDFDFC